MVHGRVIKVPFYNITITSKQTDGGNIVLTKNTLKFISSSKHIQLENVYIFTFLKVSLAQTNTILTSFGGCNIL